MNIKSTLKQVLPRSLVNKIRKRNAVWKGNFSCWEDVARECTGYDQELILEKIEQATSQVVEGKFPYERDSMLFHEILYSWPLLSGLLWSHSLQGELNVLDFGGSLGSTYRQNKKFLEKIRCSWNIVEQKKFVQLGKEKFQTEQLRFHESIADCLKTTKINTLLISSTLQYLEDPVSFLSKTVNENSFPIIVLDRLSIIQSEKNRLTRQSVPKHIYSASYPCWFFSESIILAPLKQKYELIERFESVPKEDVFIDGDTASIDVGYIFKLKPNNF